MASTVTPTSRRSSSCSTYSSRASTSARCSAPSRPPSSVSAPSPRNCSSTPSPKELQRDEPDHRACRHGPARQLRLGLRQPSSPPEQALREVEDDAVERSYRCRLVDRRG